MLPLSDFNVVCCALATFSAAVGYRLSRQRRNSEIQRRFNIEQHRSLQSRRSGSPASVLSVCDHSSDSTLSEQSVTDSPTPSENTLEDTEPGTLKRKHRDEDDESLVDEQSRHPSEKGNPAPLKRVRITPQPEEMDGKLKTEETGLITSAEPPQSDVSLQSKPMEEVDSHAAVVKVVTEISEPLRNVPLFTPALPPIQAVKPSCAFASFANSTSPFLVAPVAAASAMHASVWCSGGTTDFVAPGSCSSAQKDPRNDEKLGGIEIHGAKNNVGEKPGVKQEDPLAAQFYAKSSHTGEEDEEVAAELKGVKVFIKRGDREFSDAILGHVKLLSHKQTGDERLLFRRELVWKVSMSVRLCPTVRCSFDEDQGVLRVSLKETEECEGIPPEKWQQRVVVYALKRGKTSKSDFADFAHAVTSSSPLFAPSST
ncbi:uncharacterized protein FIBRA_04771 [Fibroporia radiculosa]|uniref:RanBD1 domain-containing protein n=1 Tax=Fibroporia radiculosa TaxID=599839 RepID=J4HWQ4_9APHY|nr:uncharacterized protein FIBRA_04771 [Fibroporia radiculosa]CCM02667.1 predicted protein [Fibroporia radiculosa]